MIEYRDKTEREMCFAIVAQLKQQRLQYEPQMIDVRDYLAPYRMRLNLSEATQKVRRDAEILDSSVCQALRTFEGGMMGSGTSPARQWFRFTTADPELAEFGPVKEWLDIARIGTQNMFARSNVYRSLPVLYGDMAGFGTGAISIEEHFQKVLHTRTFTVGSYWLGTDEWGAVNTFYRESRMTVFQIVTRFGMRPGSKEIDWTNISPHVRQLWKDGQYQVWIDVGWLVTPNEEYNPRSPWSSDMRWRSYHYEMGAAGGDPQSSSYTAQVEDGKFLRIAGFDLFPILCGRWRVTDEDVYAIECPGVMSAGDLKQLQRGESKTLTAIDKILDPPLVGPPELKQVNVYGAPSKITYFKETADMKLRPIYEVNPDITHMSAKQREVRDRIYSAFYVDLFRMLALLEDRERTATEIAERKEEKLIQLAPVLEGLNTDVLDPLIDRGFAFQLKQGRLPKPPRELWGMPLKVEYVSLMAQAQKAVGLTSIDRVLNTAAVIAKVWPDIIDKVDWDQALDETADQAGAPPRMMRSDQQTAAARAARLQRMAAATQPQAVESLTKSAKQLSDTDTEGKNALTDLLSSGRAA